MAGPVGSCARTLLGLLTSCLAALERAREREHVCKEEKEVFSGERERERVSVKKRSLYAGTVSFRLWLVADNLGRQLC